jgi:hypothetical protein
MFGQLESVRRSICGEGGGTKWDEVWGRAATHRRLPHGCCHSGAAREGDDALNDCVQTIMVLLIWVHPEEGSCREDRECSVRRHGPTESQADPTCLKASLTARLRCSRRGSSSLKRRIQSRLVGYARRLADSGVLYKESKIGRMLGELVRGAQSTCTPSSLLIAALC